MAKLGTLLLIKMAVLAAFLFTAIMDSVPSTHDVWFWVFIFWWIFSAITAGMPEPEESSSFGYLWMYRSFHLLSASGTAYFIHKRKWDSISGKSLGDENG